MNHEIEFRAAQELADHAILRIEELANDGIDICDLHHELFNTDYWIIGYWAAEQWLLKCGGVFLCIGRVKDYEESEFGSVHTNLASSEAVSNMIAYIEGREVLNQSSTFRKNFNEELTPELAKEIIAELKEEYSL
jgi:hypothetical protein